ncbi:DUF6300 family protein [Streptomyces sp900105755]|uniref:DUF6300 family protein n=1 Tax=Streptomyces sp. 900105755 TaxID=3154389 RepID=A0ABV1TWI2_9ACTN
MARQAGGCVVHGSPARPAECSVPVGVGRPADRDDEEQPARPCSRCGSDLLLHWHGPLGTGVWMELCPVCDAYRPAARAFIRWHRDADRDPTALPQLFEDWETETMHAQGWARAPRNPRLPSVHLPLPASHRGRG